MSNSKKFTFLENTHIRKGIATHGNGKIIGQMYKDSKIELETPPIEGLLHEEDVLGQWQQSNKWYRDANGWYYWEKAVRKTESPLLGMLNFSKEIPFDKNFNERIKVPSQIAAKFDKIKQTGGKGVRLAIIDDYLMKDHPALKFQDPKKWINCNLPEMETDHNVFGSSSHGSSSASMVISRPFGSFPCLGVSPLVDFYFFSIEPQNNSSKNITSWEAMAKALEIAINKIQVDIISISIGLYLPNDSLTKIENLFAQAKSKNIIVFCSGGRVYDPKMSLLALNKRTIGIEAVPNSKIDLKEIDFSILEKKVSLWGWDQNKSKGQFKPGRILSSSFATPLFAGILANTLSYERESRGLASLKIPFDEVKSGLKKFCTNSFPDSINHKDKSLQLIHH